MSLLEPATVGRLRRLRLHQHRRVAGTQTGAHAARRHGSSLDFADYREYVAGDDPRRVDVHAYARLGRRLVKLYEAEDEAALRIVVDLSASMGFGDKRLAACRIAAALAVVAAGSGDRARVLLAADRLDPGPWYRGIAATPALQDRLEAAPAQGRADLAAAVDRAVREGPTGPVILVSDLLDERWPESVRSLERGRADTVVVHLVGRADLEPAFDGDVRLVDAESGDEVEVGLAQATLADYARARDRWRADITSLCRRQGTVVVAAVDDEPVESVVERLVAAGTLR